MPDHDRLKPVLLIELVGGDVAIHGPRRAVADAAARGDSGPQVARTDTDCGAGHAFRGDLRGPCRADERRQAWLANEYLDIVHARPLHGDHVGKREDAFGLAPGGEIGECVGAKDQQERVVGVLVLQPRERVDGVADAAVVDFVYCILPHFY